MNCDCVTGLILHKIVKINGFLLVKFLFVNLKRTDDANRFQVLVMGFRVTISVGSSSM